jgi:transcriptional regulator with XRE-family HTH domain
MADDGSPLRRWRKARGLTQAQLGALLDLSQSAVARLEAQAPDRITRLAFAALSLAIADYDFGDQVIVETLERRVLNVAPR